MSLKSFLIYWFPFYCFPFLKMYWLQSLGCWTCSLDLVIVYAHPLLCSSDLHIPWKLEAGSRG